MLTSGSTSSAHGVSEAGGVEKGDLSPGSFSGPPANRKIIRGWRPWEEDMVRERYPREGAVMLARQLRRTPSAVSGKASKLGLCVEPAVKTRNAQLAMLGNRLAARKVERQARETKRFGIEAWPEERINLLCDLMAEDHTFAEAALRMGTTRSAIAGQWKRIRDRLGWQAQ